ncbi:CD209 antigen-like protein C [Labeo rohita]|uniref:CD209 antigen-like protein C n=1 Tax=Labeo rohita TaxID=84645 RepID=UPI0021E29729|nr:CD209 antigen-like protein C [Labeo rohita]
MCKRNSTGSDSVRTRRYKKVTVYLVLQSVLLLEAIVLLFTEHRTKTHQYENGKETLTKQRNQLRANIENLLQNKNVLKDFNNKTNKQHQQLTEEKNLLSKHLREMDGWRCHESSLYYISSTTKSWTDSKQDCLNRGANLTIINSKDEQDFFYNDGEVWIGLTKVEGTWKWVDGSTLTSGFSSWKPGEPNGRGGENCAATASSEWRDYSCYEALQWICERK